MKKIIYIHHNAYLGGGSLVAANNALLLSEDHDVTFVLPVEGGIEFETYLKNLNIKVERTTLLMPSFSYYSGSSSLFAINTILKTILSSFYKKKWEYFLKSKNPDIVIVNSSTLSPFGKIIKNIKASSICFNWETFNPQWYNLATKYIIKNLNNFDVVTFTSNYDKDYAKLTNAYSTIFINPIRDGFEIDSQISKEEACKRIGINSNKFNVLFLGGHSKIKGAEVMLKSLIELKENKEIQLIMAGQQHTLNLPKGFKGALRFAIGMSSHLYNLQIKKLIKRVNERITIVGLKSNVTDLYNAADIVVCPSDSPHHLLPIHEAGIFKKPIITTDFEQIRDFAVHNENALLFKHNDSKDLAEKIKQLYFVLDDRIRLGENNYERAIKNFDKNLIIAKLKNLIDQALLSSKK